MTWLGRAPAYEMTAAKAIELRQKTWLLRDPAFVFRDDVRAASVLADHERIAPDARSADVDGVRDGSTELLLIQHLRCVVLHCSAFPLGDRRCGASMRIGGSAGPRQRRGAMREGDHPAWQGASEARNRKPGIRASRAKPLPRSAGVRSTISHRSWSQPRVRADTALNAPRCPRGSCLGLRLL